VVLDQSAVLEVLDALKAADVDDRIRSGSKTRTATPHRFLEGDVLSDRCAARQLITARPSAT